ncbi:L,D-transpeptidase family protein [Ferrimonas sp. YFM]|uniref:L,D-transpeptidase family protein n=1 Tax=Ferrimonas sp. YFM TaxID=3028878 RepID=UPI00257380A1|nr:L,D-transpeptidase family protein [Ferrimonas sp. YFM]BDY04233.1 cell wall degradation protein [Ferrimonas sp. YFM]
MIKRLCLLAIFWTLGCAAQPMPLWRAVQDQQRAAEELTQHLSLLSAANVSPQFYSLHQNLEAPDLSMEERDRLLLLGFQLIEEFHRQLSERPPGADGLGGAPFLLMVPEGGEYPVLKAAEQGRLEQRVRELAPDSVQYRMARQRVIELMALESLVWPEFGKAPLLEPGDRHPQIAELRWVLKQLGDYQGQVNGDHYDDELLDSVQGFQRRHGLAADGVVGPRTRAWLRVSPRVRAQRLARNTLRQWHDRSRFADSYLLVNIPEYRLSWVTPTGERFSTRVIVGRNSRRTPRMTTEVVSLVVNPSWNVPRSIIWRDLLPKIRLSGDYLAKQRFDAYNRQGEPVQYSADQWQQAATGRFPYRLSQRPGDDNALGRYKFHLTNSKAIYLHDTPDKQLFDRSRRALSSGCVRVEGADLLARQLAFEGEVDLKRFNHARGLGETRWFRLKRPLPVYMVYWSAWVADNGVAHYRKDIYHQDGDMDHKNAIAMRSTFGR